MNKVIVKTKDLKRLLENVKNGASKKYIRPMFRGICIEVENQELMMTTCDGYKLFTDKCNIIEGDNLKVVSPIFKIPKDTDEQTIIEVENDYITFNYGQEKHSYKIIEGEFIEWKHLFNREKTFSIIFNSKYLQDALKSEKGEVVLEFSDNKSPVIINGKKLVLPIVHNY